MKTPFAILGVLAICALACGGVPVKPAPLDAEAQASLRQTLTANTWLLEATYKRPGDAREPMAGVAEITYRFGEDGTGLYSQRTVVSGDNPFDWRLDGANIVLTNTNGDDMATFRAEDWSPAEMTWFNYRTDDYFVLTPR
jgi:hypothetical protein